MNEEKICLINFDTKSFVGLMWYIGNKFYKLNTNKMKKIYNKNIVLSQKKIDIFLIKKYRGPQKLHDFKAIVLQFQQRT